MLLGLIVAFVLNHLISHAYAKKVQTTFEACSTCLEKVHQKSLLFLLGGLLGCLLLGLLLLGGLLGENWIICIPLFVPLLLMVRSSLPPCIVPGDVALGCSSWLV